MSTYNKNPYILKSTAHYTQWREHIATSLRARGLWNFAFDDVKEPVALEDETAVHLFNQIEEYHQKQQQTAGYIGLSLGPHFRSLIKGKEDDPQAIMQHLDRELRPKTNATRMDLLRHFISIRRKPDKEIEVFFTRIKATQAELEESGMVASPAYQLLAILDGLPPEYDTVRTVIESEDRIDVERAKRLIRQQDGMFTAHSQVTSVNATSFSRGKPRNRDQDRDRRPRTDRPRDDSNGRPSGRRSRRDERSQRKSDRSQDEPVCCHEPGHVRPDCPKLHAAKRGGSRANVAMDDADSSSEDKTILSVTDQVNVVSDETGHWYLDSGATRHVTCRKDLLHDFVDYSHKDRSLLLGNNYRCPILGRGTIKATVTVNGATQRIAIHQVLYAPELAKNLLSTALIARNGHQVRIDSHGCSVISTSGKTVMPAHLSGNMLRLPIKPIPPPPAPAQELTAKEPTVDVNELHRQLGHAHEKRLRAVLKEQGLKWPEAGLAECTVCLRGKATRKPVHKTPMLRATAPMERLHSDVCGPVSVSTRDGKRYFVSFVDDHSRYATVYLLRAKNEVKDALQHLLRSAPSGRKCRFLHTDQGGEYKNDDIAKLLFDHGITHETTSSHTPEHNRVAKHFNRTIIDMVHCMLLDSSLPKNLWGEALFLAVAVNNPLPTSANSNVAPIVKWDATLQPSIAHLHRFGAAVQVLIPLDQQSKLGPRTRDGVYLGPARENATHHCVLVQGRIIKTRNVTSRSATMTTASAHRPKCHFS